MRCLVKDQVVIGHSIENMGHVVRRVFGMGEKNTIEARFITGIMLFVGPLLILILPAS